MECGSKLPLSKAVASPSARLRTGHRSPEEERAPETSVLM